MPNVENVAFVDILNGQYQNPPKSTILIQIVDPDMEFPTPLDEFQECHQFQFLDLSDPGKDDINLPKMITVAQAEKLVDILNAALSAGTHVTVHCVAGLCRSGAVAEFAEMIGFKYIGRVKRPNVFVKNSLIQAAGFGYHNG